MHHPTHQQMKEAAHVSPIMPDQPDELVSIPLAPEQVAEFREQIKTVLSDAGAFCGECGFQPGDRGCPDCERCWDSYTTALMPILQAASVAVEHRTRWAVAEDFVRQGKASDSLTWGQAVYIARDGLCGCSGGLKPCDMGGAL